MARSTATLLVLLASIASHVEGCNQECLERTAMENSYIQSIQDRILLALHLRVPPTNITIPDISKARVQELYDEDEDDAPMRRAVLLPKPCPNGVKGCITFNITESTRDASLTAVLRFTIDLSSLDTGSGIDGTINYPADIVIRSVRPSGEILEEPIMRDSMKIGESERVVVDLGIDVIKLWVAGEGIKVSVDIENNQIPINAVDGNPTLTLDLDKVMRRDPRNTDQYCPAGSEEKHCCLHDMVIDFHQLGWNFIMAPSVYNAYMCRGDCVAGVNHVLRFGHSKIMRDAVSYNGPHCCYPSDYESLKIIYTRADHEVIITRVPGMIARRCSCA